MPATSFGMSPRLWAVGVEADLTWLRPEVEIQTPYLAHSKKCLNWWKTKTGWVRNPGGTLASNRIIAVTPNPLQRR